MGVGRVIASVDDRVIVSVVPSVAAAVSLTKGLVLAETDVGLLVAAACWVGLGVGVKVGVMVGMGVTVGGTMCSGSDFAVRVAITSAPVRRPRSSSSCTSHPTISSSSSSTLPAHRMACGQCFFRSGVVVPIRARILIPVQFFPGVPPGCTIAGPLYHAAVGGGGCGLQGCRGAERFKTIVLQYVVDYADRGPYNGVGSHFRVWNAILFKRRYPG
jgi:hypothetical protein